MTRAQAKTANPEGKTEKASSFRVSQPGDRLELEADRVADEVLRSPVTGSLSGAAGRPPVQRKCAACEAGGAPCPACSLSVGPEAVAGASAPLQGKFTTNEMSAQPQGKVGKAKNRSGLPRPLKAGLEALSGMDLSGVRVHDNSSKPARLNALAYTQGQDIHVGPGQEKHLPHEGWHAVQQMQGRVKPTIQAKGVSINDDAGLEREADVMGAKAVQINGQQEAGNQGVMTLLNRESPVIQRDSEASTVTRDDLWTMSLVKVFALYTEGLMAQFIDTPPGGFEKSDLEFVIYDRFRRYGVKVRQGLSGSGGEFQEESAKVAQYFITAKKIAIHASLGSRKPKRVEWILRQIETHKNPPPVVLPEPPEVEWRHKPSSAERQLERVTMKHDRLTPDLLSVARTVNRFHSRAAETLNVFEYRYAEAYGEVTRGLEIARESEFPWGEVIGVIASAAISTIFPLAKAGIALRTVANLFISTAGSLTGLAAEAATSGTHDFVDKLKEQLPVPHKAARQPLISLSTIMGKFAGVVEVLLEADIAYRKNLNDWLYFAKSQSAPIDDHKKGRRALQAASECGPVIHQLLVTLGVFAEHINVHDESLEALPYDYDLTIPAEVLRLTSIVVEEAGRRAYEYKFFRYVVNPVTKDMSVTPTRYKHLNVTPAYLQIDPSSLIRHSVERGKTTSTVFGRTFLYDEDYEENIGRTLLWIGEEIEKREQVTLRWPGGYRNTMDYSGQWPPHPDTPNWMLDPIISLSVVVRKSDDEVAKETVNSKISYLRDNSAVAKNYLKRMFGGLQNNRI